jgi:hypothetical protein
MRYQYDPHLFLRIKPFLLQLLDRLDASHEILGYRVTTGEIHAQETWIPATSMATVADSVAGIAVTNKKRNIREPDRGATEAAVCEEERRS